MPKYKLTIKRTIVQYYDFIVEADNAHAARDKLEHESRNGDLDYVNNLSDVDILDESILPEITEVK